MMERTNTDIDRFLRSEMTVFKGYAACKSPEVVAQRLGIQVADVVKLDANENNYGASPRVARALADFTYFNIYPDAAQTEVRQELEHYTKVPAEQIVLGAGSDQLIELILKLFAAPGDEIINLGPSFPMYSFYAGLGGNKVVEVARDENFYVDIASIRRAVSPKTKLIFLANPNNPTGTMTSFEDVRTLAEIGVPLVVDEAYFEFTGVTAIPLMKTYQNVMVLRTFSKWSGLAGLRVGYGLFPPLVADCLHSIRDPYNVNIMALIALKESLRDIDYLMGNVDKIIQERERLLLRFTEMDWLKPYPSQSNFILCDLLRGDAKQVQQKLEDKGILVRHYADARLKNCIRFSVGKPTESDKLLTALQEIGGQIK
ncbi:MAG: histidinol-phosphate transaminase [Dehalococcoidia bacterium]|nr:histidinol-phosphate transaminase [Dehalococcoidia bacterium]